MDNSGLIQKNACCSYIRKRVTLSSHCGPLYIPLSHTFHDCRSPAFNRHSIWAGGPGFGSGAVALKIITWAVSTSSKLVALILCSTSAHKPSWVNVDATNSKGQQPATGLSGLDLSLSWTILTVPFRERPCESGQTCSLLLYIPWGVTVRHDASGLQLSTNRGSSAQLELFRTAQWRAVIISHML